MTSTSAPIDVETYAGTLLELLDDELRSELSLAGELSDVLPGTTLRTLGASPETVDVVLSGTVLLTNAKGRQTRIVERGDVGILELLRELPNESQAIAETPARILRIPATAFSALLTAQPLLRDYLRKRAAATGLQRFEQMLRQYNVAPRTRWLVIGSAGRDKLGAGETVAREGEAAVALWIVERGKLTGWKNMSGTDVLVGELGAGDVFAAAHAWKAQPMPATYRTATDDVVVLTIAAAVLQEAAESDAGMRSLLEAYDVTASSGAATGTDPVSEDEEPEDEDDTPLDLFFVDKSPPPKRPKSVVLQQYDQMDCGAACMAMVAHAHGRKISVSTYRSIVHVTREGASMWSLLQAARKTGFQATGVMLGLDALKDVHLPAIALMEYHFVVVYRVTDNEVWLGDPAFDRLRKVPTDVFLRTWSGTALLLRPTDALAAFPESRASYRKYLQILNRNGRLLAEVLASTLVLFGVGLAGPLLTQVMFDAVLVDKSPSALSMLVIGMTAVAVFQVAISFAREHLFSHLALKIDAVFSTLFYRHVLKLPLGFFMVRRVGDLLTRLGELRAIREFFSSDALSVVVEATSLFVYLGVIWLMSGKLALVIAVCIPAIAVVTRLVSKRLRDKHQALFSDDGKLTGTVAEQFRALETIKSLGAELPARWRWEYFVRRRLATRFDVEKLQIFLNSANDFIEKVTLTGILYAGARMVIDGELTVGQAIAASQLAAAALGPINRLSDQWSRLQRVAVSFARVEDIFSTSPEPDGAPAIAPKSHRISRKPVVQGNVEFDNVWFQYGSDGSPWVLRGVDLQIRAGETVALVGRSGSGKTTLAQMVNLLYRPTRGGIKLDGVDASTLPLETIRSSIGIVMQDNQLFAGTIYENITLGDIQPSMEKAIEAAKVANAHDFIVRQKDGYQTLLGEGGSGLSGGQKQRINIARALYRKPSILVLDEATSSLDAESERAVVEGMRRFCKGRTSIIIAHRLSTILYADRIVLLERGRVVEQGNHHDLIKRGGPYARLFGAQLAL